MKSTIAIVALLLIAATAAAQDPAAASASPSQAEPPKKIDTSPGKLMRLLAESEEPPPPPRRIEVHFGVIDVRAFGTRFRIGYLPFAMPFIGARFTSTKEFPDGMTMLGLAVPTTARQYQRSRALNRELRRIDKLTKINATVRATP